MKKVKWLVRDAAPPRQYGAEEWLEDHVADAQIARGVAEDVTPKKSAAAPPLATPSAASLDAPPTDRAVASPKAKK